jgi:predicted polyphosphate/ATP-dependent NAD kinase
MSIGCMQKKLGLIVNPIAGMGGRVGLKGTDGSDIFAKALELGAKPVSPARTVEALRIIKRSGLKFEMVTYPGEMGEDEAREAGLEARVMGEIVLGKTSAEDTKRAAREIVAEGVDLLLIGGGDGTLNDVIEVIDMRAPVLGIPCGVKLQSAAFASTPEAAGVVAVRFLRDGLPTREAEVVDIDEESYRKGRLSAKIKGYTLVPYEPVMVQGTKEGSASHELEDQKAIARWVVEMMEKGRIYVLGPGTTTRAVAEELGIRDSNLLGVDLILDRKLLAQDVNERQILKAIEGKPAAMILSPIGGQGFIFGRGNQQISPDVIRKIGKGNLMVIATPEKLGHTPLLNVDTGDSGLDGELRGYIPVIIGYRQKRMIKVS